MLGNTFGLPHLILILVIVLLLFGAPKLPGLARSLGQSMKIFRNEIKDPNAVEGDEAADTATVAEKPASAAKKPKSS